jgi:hypothetical protein
MYKTPKKPKSTKFKAVIGVFSVLGLTIVSLGVLMASKSATSKSTDLASQAYSGWSGDVQTGAYQERARRDGINKAGVVPQESSAPITPPQNNTVYVPIVPQQANPPPQNNTVYVPIAPQQANPPPQNNTVYVPIAPQQANPPAETTTTQTSGNTGVTQQTTTTQTSDPAKPTTTVIQGGMGTDKPSSGGGGGDSDTSKPKKPTYRDDGDDGSTANAMACKESIITQFYIRGGQGWAREVMIGTDGKPQWSKAAAFRKVIDLRQNKNALPGEGAIQAYHAHVNPLTGTFLQYLVRDNRFYVKRVPTYKGKIDWTVEARYNWEDYDFGKTQNIPTGGNISGYNMAPTIMEKDGAQYIRYNETLIRDNKTYVNNDLWDKFVNGKKVEESDGKYVQAADLNPTGNPTALPGSGKIQGQSDYVDPNGKVLHQAWYRGNIGYVRDVVIENGVPNFSKATPILSAINLNPKSAEHPSGNPSALGGDGEFEAVSNYINCWSN